MAYPPPAFRLLQQCPEIEIEDEDQPSSPTDRNSACAMDVFSSGAPSTSTAADPSSSNYDYDIFISHRGPDTKKTFASSLHRRLLKHRYRVFLDREELQQGETIISQIEGAIATASVHVAVLSPRYAESKWCLDELVQMLESEGTVIPVFYKVKPAEIRWARGTDGQYAQDLKQLETKMTYGPHGETPRYDSTTVEKWRSALFKVAGICGFELEECNGGEGELLDKVVECVLQKVKNPGLNVAKYPIGLNEKVKEFEDLVLLPQQQSKKPQMVGILGSGGVGKTTLAKEIFNRKSSYYSRSCFLFNVRDKAAKGLNILQSELLTNLTGLVKHIDSVPKGIEMLKKHLSSCHALIILDDVDHGNQMDALLPAQDALRPDSLIVITSRHKNVLRISGVEESAIYRLPGLNLQHSRELFCFHAFHGPHPRPGFESVVEEFLVACDGLPLSLKVLGALLCGKDQDISYWYQQLGKLQKILPEDIIQILKISYEALDEEEQHIFLDIAFFFIGKNKDMAIKIWEGSGWHGSLDFENLENRCLVEVDSGNNIRMHDHLRDMGRQIEKASTTPRRLWHKTQSIDDLDDLLQQYSSGNEEVRGIRTVLGGDIDPIFRSEMSRCKSWSRKFCLRSKNSHGDIRARKLHLLDTEDGLLEAILSRVHPPNLIWLRWSKCPNNSLPSWIPMKNLRVLHVFGSHLATLWQDESQAPLKLRELVIDGPILSLPKSIGLLKDLELIVLGNSPSNLKSLPDEFCFLRSLKRFELTNCSKIKSLPASFGDLTNLQHIDLSHSYYLQTLPKSFASLIQLKHLNLSHCYNLTMSSETFGKISTLEYIDISYCTKIETLPPQVARQQSLRNLYFSGTNYKELPGAIGDLKKLEILVLECPFLEMQPSSLGNLTNLKELTLRYCKSLNCLPDSVGLLNHVTVYDCAFRELSVKKVEGETEILRQSRGKGILSNFDSSNDKYMPRFQINREIQEASFAGLQHLLVESCNDLVEVGTLPNTLITLQVKCCCNLKKIEGLGSLAKLQMLDISQCIKLDELPNMETFLSLKVLDANECVKLKSIRGLAQLKELRVLDVSGCSEIQELIGVEHLGSLEMLNANKCPKLQWDEQLPPRLKYLLQASTFQASPNA